MINTRQMQKKLQFVVNSLKCNVSSDQLPVPSFRPVGPGDGELHDSRQEALQHPQGAVPSGHTSASPRAGSRQRPEALTAHFTLLNLKVPMDGPCGEPKDTEGGGGTLRDRIHLHKKGSMLISKEEQGMVSSNLVITSG